MECTIYLCLDNVCTTALAAVKAENELVNARRSLVELNDAMYQKRASFARVLQREAEEKRLAKCFIEQLVSKSANAKQFRRMVKDARRESEEFTEDANDMVLTTRMKLGRLRREEDSLADAIKARDAAVRKYNDVCELRYLNDANREETKESSPR